MYVEMKNIFKQYGNFRASDNVNFGIEKGKLVALLGPSGSGKTTILRMIAGLETPSFGDIYIDGKRVNDVPANQREIGFVFQNYALFRHMTVYDNIAFGLKLKKVPKDEIKKRVTELLDITGLAGLEKRYPNQLSGGQRQRVAFARALAPNPSVLLLDEPFAAIDAKVRTELRTWLRSMVTRLGITSIFVTHDQDEAVEVADEIIITNHGKIEQMGSPIEIYKSPATPFVVEFIGKASEVNDYSKLSPSGKTYKVGDVINVSGETYSYPDNFDVIVLRDKVAVTVRDKKIEAITKLEEYTYTGTPVINSRGFEIRLNGEDDYNNLINDLNAIETANKPLNDEFFNKWTKFDTYRKIIFKDEVWEYVI